MSNDTSYTANVKCVVVPMINHNLPVESFDKSEISVPEMYMDDLVTEKNTIEEAIVLPYNVINILKSGGFDLAK